ncbi:pimeloyl-ACP methyl ester carboxylesterase [Allocatelliglobosispora scoriae]|uniref:Pimeloyl-ACP methyl ester carboxylesterase n=1 Tax=Allocatelliglobosispora scoriae TaxID=643052 RepID=A0A841C1Z1_9ACTN|nr:alpha/beta fold hydrolase [Allocatelliglobosispora scoriae]MBB5873896.1 pimeloyl-ACP methyl ester carboxylesterase [Allocatelliglobosispora scoriae]
MDPYLTAYDAVLARWPVPVERIDLAGRFGTTRVNACGDPDAPPLVLLHGGGATSTVWFANVGALAATHRVYAIDLLTDGGRGSYDGDKVTGLADLMEWLGATLDGLGVRQTGLVGHSYGAWIALRFALHSPQRVSGLALLDPTKCFCGQSARYALRGARALLGSPARMREFLAWEAGGRTIDPGWLEVMAGRPGGRTGLVWPKRPDPAVLRALPTRTLVLLAERSRHHDVAAAAQGARLLPDVEVVVIPGATHHTMPTEDADALNAELTRFFAPA